MFVHFKSLSSQDLSTAFGYVSLSEERFIIILFSPFFFLFTTLRIFLRVQADCLVNCLNILDLS